MSNTSLNILLLAPYLPALDTTACARKIYDSINVLYNKGHHIYLLSFCSDNDKVRINAISRYCKQIYLEHKKDYSRYPSKSVNLSKNIEFLCKNKIADILQCENSYLSRYIPDRINIPAVLIEHEVLNSSFYERAKFENNPINKLVLYVRSAKKLLESKRWYHKFNKVVVFSKEDKDIISRQFKVKNIEIIPLGIDSKEYALAHEKKIYDLIFVGNFSHAPNVDAAIYLYKDILSMVRKHIPNISLVIAGANPPLCIRKIAKLDKNIVVTGYMQNINRIYSMGKIFVAPIRYGSGMRLKILEAMASGLPVITTSLGARGINHKDNLEIADTEKNFSDTVIKLLNDQDRYNELAIKGRSAIKQYYDWETLIEKYENIYYELIKQRSYAN